MSFRKYVSPYALELGDLESGDCFVEGQRSCTKIEETSSGIRCTFEREGLTRSVLCLQGVLDSGWVPKLEPLVIGEVAVKYPNEARILNEAFVAGAEAEQTTPKRGRPPGSKNKPRGDS